MGVSWTKITTLLLISLTQDCNRDTVTFGLDPSNACREDTSTFAGVILHQQVTSLNQESQRLKTLRASKSILANRYIKYDTICLTLQILCMSIHHAIHFMP